MATQAVKGVVRQVRPLKSLDSIEAKRRVFRLYKLWYRELAPAIADYNLPVTLTQARLKLKDEFMKHKYLTDIRAIDALVVKGQMELKETKMRWKQQSQLMYIFKDTQISQPKTFLGKFLAGLD